MSRSTHDVDLILGGEPRVNLLPPEVAEQATTRALRKTLILATAGVLVIVVVGIGGAFWHAAQSTVNLMNAQAHTAELLTEQTKYVKVREVQTEVDTALAARAVGGATEIDWKAYLGAVRAVLPADVTITTVTVDSSTPLAPFAQPTAPLQGPRVATVTVSVSSPTLPPVPAWLEQLQTLPGFADATPSSIASTDAAPYLVTLVMHVNAGAFTNRFSQTTDDAATEPDPAADDSAAAPTGGN